MQMALSLRTIDFNNLKIGGDTSFPYVNENSNKTSPLFALEILVKIPDTFPQFLKDYWGEDVINDPVLWFEKAQDKLCDVVSVKFNIDEEDDIEFYVNLLKKIVDKAQKPLLIRGADSKLFDQKLVKILAQNTLKPSIIAFAQDLNYGEIVPQIVKGNHIAVLRTPIDINLSKELNILSSDLGLSPDKILIDPGMGGLGYGLDYGYSIIERIRIAGFEGDKMLNMPIITFIGEEAFKAKESKSDKFDSSWGEYEKRSALWEISSASAVIASGANLVVLWSPKTIEVLKGALCD